MAHSQIWANGSQRNAAKTVFDPGKNYIWPERGWRPRCTLFRPKAMDGLFGSPNACGQPQQCPPFHKSLDKQVNGATLGIEWHQPRS
jgi:hypothetical protein